MRRYGLLVAFALTAAAPAQAGPAEEATAAVTHILDRFNAGDFEAFSEAHSAGATIVDELPPFIWSGSGSPRLWADDYGRDAEARGISDGRIVYAAPIQAVGQGDSAYVVLPTIYRFVQAGRRMAGTGSMTFVMSREGGIWKIRSWTYSGATPAPE